jgi:FAD/FMN-containing dehydrogenase
MPATQRELSDEDWKELIYLAHADKGMAFDRYASYYLSTNGQLYWSDTHQLSPYFDGYHRSIDRRLHSPEASEVLTELYVPRPRLGEFLTSATASLRDHGDEVIYGTVRLIERDEETVLAWARQRYACIVMNLHVVHTETEKRRAAEAFRNLIDLAIGLQGSFYLTYHRHATRAQVETCYPRLAEFLREKLEYDPRERFQSEWYRHYRRLFA